MLLQIEKVICLSFITASISFTITETKIFLPIREWVKKRNASFGELLSCGYCFGHWIAFILVSIYQPSLFELWWLLDYFLTALVVAWLAAFQWATLCWLMEKAGKQFEIIEPLLTWQSFNYSNKLPQYIHNTTCGRISKFIHRLLYFISGLAILIVLLAVDYWIFSTWLNTTYIQWYLANGSLIGLVTSMVSLAWGDDMVEEHTGLISPHPFDYIGSYLQLVGLPIYALSTHLRGNKVTSKPQVIFDSILAVPFFLILTGVMIIWIVVVVPFQYFVYLICGAPIRFSLLSKRQIIAQFKERKLEIKEISSDEEVPTGWWSASIIKKPIAVTNLFVSLFFLIVNPLIDRFGIINIS